MTDTTETEDGESVASGSSTDSSSSTDSNSDDAVEEVKAKAADSTDDDDSDDETEDEEEAKKEKKEKVVAAKTPPKKKTPKKSPASKKKESDKPTNESTPKSTGKASAPSASPGKKPLIQLVHDTIVALKDRTGSSQLAIQKYMLATYPDVTAAKLKSRLLLSLKAGLKNQRFLKVKASFKIHPDFIKKKKKQNQREKAKRAAAKKKAAAAKKKKEKEQPKLTPAQLAAKRERERQEAIRRERLERIKRRRFPMDDIELIKEDKELKVSVSLPSRPSLPVVFSSYLSDGMSKSDTTWSGLWDEALHIYHFFRGDVGWGQQLESQFKLYIVAPFTLQQWRHAVEQIVCGNSKQSRMLPPLVNHLFCVALQYLCRDVTKLQIGLSPSSWSEILLLYMDAMERYATSEASLIASERTNVVEGLPIDADYLLGATDKPKTVAGTSGDEEAQVLYFSDELVLKAHSKLLLQDPWMLSAEELMALLRCLVDDLMGVLPAVQDVMDSRSTDTNELLKKKRAADALVRKLQLAVKMKQDASKPPAEKKATSPKNSDSKDKDSKANDDEGENDGAAKGSGEGGDESSKPQAPKRTASSSAKSKQMQALTSKSEKTLNRELDAAKKAQQRVTADYEKAIHSDRVRTEPIGYDRHFNAVYFFANDPQCIYVHQRGGLTKPTGVTTTNGNAWEVPLEFRHHKATWQILDKKSVFDSFLESLDVRGKRECALHEAMKPLRRHLFDDIKIKQDQKASLREKEELQRRLENAKLKCDFGRKSGRLAGKAEEEFSVLQAEIDALQRSIKGESKPKPIDWEEVTGLDLMRRFDQRDIFQPCPQEPSEASQQPKKRATRRDAQMQQELEDEQVKAASEDGPALDKLRCSELWPSSDRVDRGVIGLIASSMRELESRCQNLAEWDRGAEQREAWIENLKSSVRVWDAANPRFLVPAAVAKNDESSSSPIEDGDITMADASIAETPGDKRKSSGGANGSAKKRKADSPGTTGLSIPQMISMLKQPLLELEARVFELSGLAMAARDADEADDNMSTSEEDEAAKEAMAWKRIVFRLTRMPAKAHVKIRQAVVDAIAAARKAQLGPIVAELRSALLLFHPEAAGQCKAATLEVLERHGGYDDFDEDDEDDDEDEQEGQQELPPIDELDTGLSSVLCAEAVILNSSLDGQEDAGRADWIAAVKKTKTISKFAALTEAFVEKAFEKLEKLESEREDLLKVVAAWQKAERRKSGGKEIPGPSEVWTDVTFTDEFCWAKVEEYPWWPAKKCIVKDTELAESLESLGRCLVSLVGESGGLRVVKKDVHVMPFTETHPDDDLSDHSKDIRSQLEDCMAVARRIVRGKEKKAAKAARYKKKKPPPANATKPVEVEFKEEKKLAS